MAGKRKPGGGDAPPPAGGGTYPATPLPDEQIQREAAEANERNTPFMAACTTCGHEWPAAFVPMPMGLLGEILTASRCPKGCTNSTRVGHGGASGKGPGA